MPLLMRPMAICRLFISPSSSGAERLTELNELSSKARKRMSTWEEEMERCVNKAWEERVEGVLIKPCWTS